MAKQLKLSDVKKLVKDLTKVQKFYIDKEQTQYINYHPKFSKKKVNELFLELHETLQYVAENKKEYPSNDLEIIQYVQFLIIKHFTSLKQELKGLSYEEHIETVAKLMEVGLFERFFNEMFDEAEVYEVLDELERKVEIGYEIIQKENETQNELLNKLQSDKFNPKES